MTPDAVLTAINRARADAHLRPLRMEHRLQQVAQEKADDMVRRRYFAHTGPDGKKPWDLLEEAGYSYSKMAENLAEGQQTPEALRAAWMGSAGHRDNILERRFVHTGVGIAQRGHRYVVVQVFAAPASRESD